LLVIKNKITCRKSVENDALLFWPLSPLSLPHPSPPFYPLWLHYYFVNSYCPPPHPNLIFSCCESRSWQQAVGGGGWGGRGEELTGGKEFSEQRPTPSYVSRGPDPSTSPPP
jgi:hypothetical protein